LRRELLDLHEPFESLAAAQQAVDARVREYNTTRPHQALGMASPAERFRPVPDERRKVLPLRLPAELRPAPDGAGVAVNAPDSVALAAPACDDPCRGQGRSSAGR
jgi:hypothetical protein